MHASVARAERVTAPARGTDVEALLVFDCTRDVPLVALPRAEVQVVVRFGPSAERGLDVHVMGPKRTAHRKLIRRGQSSVTARLDVGAAVNVLGVPGALVADRITALADLWGEARTERLLDRLSGTRSQREAAEVLGAALAERRAEPDPNAGLARAAAARLPAAPVSTVAAELGVSERHLRRVFRRTTGLGPKTFVRLFRFHHALELARDGAQTGWAGVAAAAGYYDQAHLIAEFRALAGTTPSELLRELAPQREARSSPSWDARIC